MGNLTVGKPKYAANEPRLRELIAEYGSMTLGVTADEIECGLTEKGGTARFGYLLDANSAELVSRNRLEVTVTHVN